MLGRRTGQHRRIIPKPAHCAGFFVPSKRYTDADIN
jgi:hypothetical protein